MTGDAHEAGDGTSDDTADPSSPRPSSRPQKPLPPPKFPDPAPGSPFYVPPPSTQALRRHLAIKLFPPALLAIAAMVFLAIQHWSQAAILMGMALGLVLLRRGQIAWSRTELRRRRAGESGDEEPAVPPGVPPGRPGHENGA